MLERVFASLTGSAHVGEILISIDDPEAARSVPAIRDALDDGAARLTESGGDLFRSVAQALDGAAFPALVCTADNALQTTEMVDHFVEGFAARDAEVGVGVTNAEVIWAKYPDGQRRPHRFRDGLFSNCNLFALRSKAGVAAAKAFEGGGQFGKSKRRVLQAFGLLNLLLYKSAWLTLDGVFRRISRKFGVVVEAIDMPFAEAPIDVDNARTERIAREILKARAAEIAEKAA